MRSYFILRSLGVGSLLRRPLRCLGFPEPNANMTARQVATQDYNAVHVFRLPPSFETKNELSSSGICNHETQKGSTRQTTQ
ncbi:hypothetical protein IWZ01DRAFT_302589 [Phyllosticta capitalensis]